MSSCSNIIILEAIPVDEDGPLEASLQMPLNESLLFERYDELDAVLAKVGNAGQAKLLQESNLNALQKKLNATESQLAKNRKAQPYTARRLDRNAHPHFFHYLQINREQKVRRLEQELETLRLDERRLEQDRQVMERDIKSTKVRVEQLRRDEETANIVGVERQRIIDEVVRNSGVPNQIQHMTSEVFSFKSQLQVEAGLITALNSTMAQVNQARQLFQQAHQALLRANNDNIAARYEAQAEMYTMFGENDFYEVSMQRDRDRMLNVAKTHASTAGQMLQAAFDSFPMEARIRFPDITRDVCNAPIPLLHGGNYAQTINQDWMMGAYGAYCNDVMAQGKINQNMGVLMTCEQLAAQQANAILTVINQVQAHHHSLEKQIVSLKQQIQAEKTRIFNMIHASIHSHPKVPERIPSMTQAAVVF